MIKSITSADYSSQNVSFKGGKFNVLKCALDKSKKINRDVVANILEMEPTDFVEMNKPLKRHKAGFFYNLTKKFNQDRYDKKLVDLDKTKDIIFDLYKKVKYPNVMHRNLINNADYSFEQINKIVNLTNKDSNLLSLSDKLLTTYGKNELGGRMPFETMEAFLESKYSKEIAKHYKKYESFVQLNLNNKNIVEDLEKQIATKIFDEVIEKNKFIVSQKITRLPMFAEMDLTKLAVGYSPTRVKLMEKIDSTYRTIDFKSIKKMQSLSEEMMDIYTTTTAKNYKTRKNVFEFLKESGLNKKENISETLPLLKEIFKKTEKSNNINSFVYSILYGSSYIKSTKELSDIINTVNITKLNNNIDAVKYILLQNRDAKNRVELLNKTLNDNTLLQKAYSDLADFKKIITKPIYY